ncbi:hypothetical protein Ndes2526B_g02780 [Nannochloris sp. 'desiccata']
MDSDSEATAPQLYCSKVQTSDGATWFAGIELIAKLDQPSELMDATFNLTITDGQRAWIGQDLNEFSLGQTITDRMKHALEALVQYQPPTERYSLKFTEQAADLLVEIEWDNSRHGKDITARLHVLLSPATDTAGSIRELMKNILQESASLRLEAAALTAAWANLENAVQSDVKKLETYAKSKEQLEDDLALKGAALLVAKQQHLNGLLRQQQQQRAKHGGS